MKHLALAMAAFLFFGCTVQQRIDRAFSADLGFEKLYGSTAFSVYYDPIAKQCVAYAIMGAGKGGTTEGIGIGLDTFSCDPVALREAARATATD